MRKQEQEYFAGRLKEGGGVVTLPPFAFEGGTEGGGGEVAFPLDIPLWGDPDLTLETTEK